MPNESAIPSSKGAQRFIVQITPSGLAVASEDGVFQFLADPSGAKWTALSARRFAGWLTNNELGQQFATRERAACDSARRTGYIGDNGEVILDPRHE